MEPRNAGDGSNNCVSSAIPNHGVLSIALHPIPRGRRPGCLLTEALGNLPAPRAVPLASQHGGQGELVPLQAGVAHTGAPAEIGAHHFAVGNGLWGLTDDS